MPNEGVFSQESATSFVRVTVLFRDESDTQGREQSPQDRTFAELLIDCEEDRTLRAVLVGMLREDGQGSSR
jgi:hypothetical protein